MSQDKCTLPSTAGREKEILEHLKTLGFNMGENPTFVKPAKKRTWSFNKVIKNRVDNEDDNLALVRNNRTQEPRLVPKAPMQAVKGLYKDPDYQGLIRLPDGSFEVPQEWKTNQKDKETRRQIIAAKNKLHRIVEALETRNKNRYRNLINAHRKTCQDLLLCLS